MKEKQTDVLVVGSGLVGLVAAHCMSSLNYNVIIVDKKIFNKPKKTPMDIRTVAVSEGSKQFLDSLFLWDGIRNFVEPIKKIGNFFWIRGDQKTIDRYGPDGISKLIKFISNKALQFQTGYIYDYAFVMLIGLSALITYLILK